MANTLTLSRSSVFQTREMTEPETPDPEAIALDEVEARMRLALNIQQAGGTLVSPSRTSDPWGSSRPPRRKRFAREGEVKVTVIPRHGLAMHQDPEEAAVARERQRRLEAERGLREAQAALDGLRTRLAHAEMARDEAVGEAMARSAALETLRTEILLAEQAIVQLQEETARLAAICEQAERALEAERARREAAEARVMASVPLLVEAPRRHGRGRPKGAKNKPKIDPQPVKWWTKAWRAGETRKMG